MKKIFAIVGVVLLLTGAYFTFRRPTPLSDRAQIRQDLDEAETALEDGSAARLSRFLADDFHYEGMNRKDFNTMLAGTMWQWRNVQLTRTAENIAISGDKATVTGTFSLHYDSGEGGAPQAQKGRYQLKLRRDEGQWKVTEVTGDGLPQG